MRLYPNMGDNTKQVRVDNWGIFFLQRLQMFFSKTDYCDMTLQFEGNVQLKVHRLVMNACTEYFQFLEQTCTLEENVIMMPSDLQADVIVPIVNFMYTGMLEFHLSTFDRLYKTAQVMNITILTKLLDAQKQPISSSAAKGIKKKHVDSPQPHIVPAKKLTSKPSLHSDLPAPLPGRKLPVWKRKSIPTPSPSTHALSQLSYADTKWSSQVDPLSIPDNTPKPTRFEWPEEDLPPLNPMDTSFEEISYTSKPLLTQEEEQRARTSFDDLRHIPNSNRTSVPSKKHASPNLDMEEMKNYVKEQKIRSGLSQDVEIEELEVVESGQKRKAADQKSKGTIKKLRFEESESKTTISIATDGKGVGELNHEKIVTEILKKYPQLVKKNKNIRLKIMAKNKTPPHDSNKADALQLRTPRLKVTDIQKAETPKVNKSREIDLKNENKAPWICERCSSEGEPVEFILYYLYRKHMTDVHDEKFDPKLCKYCGHRCNKQNLLMYHLYTKHGMKPPPSYVFPKCDQCPYIALSANILSKHKLRHDKNEMQCIECKLAFTSQGTLTSHIQITGHTGKSTKNNYDCQYCTKRFQSGNNLFSHVRGQHKNEALRDGIVSIDEADEFEDYDDEETPKDEYILPEIITDPDPQPSKKVNILSNVKVQERQEHHPRHQQLTLEPSSEAEALNNVATGIATSLGLVDIVVLNDNQQIFLQPNQPNFANDQNEQPEFILPELTGRDSFAQSQDQVITTDGVITQSMLSSGDIGSTDELVMVLTDHDYGDNQEEISNENSNIVVLYSHPVDGQQDQFITSQGNIMVNSQGLIEIRNGATITSTGNQVVVNSQETHIESIEMIQREIESHQELKQEALYEEETKPDLPVLEKEQGTEQIKENEQIQIRSETLIESLTQGEQIEFTSPLIPPAEPLTQDASGHLDVESVAQGSQEEREETQETQESSIETQEKNEEVSVGTVEEEVHKLDEQKNVEEKNDEDCTPLEPEIEKENDSEKSEEESHPIEQEVTKTNEVEVSVQDENEPESIATPIETESVSPVLENQPERVPLDNEAEPVSLENVPDANCTENTEVVPLDNGTEQTPEEQSEKLSDETDIVNPTIDIVPEDRDSKTEELPPPSVSEEHADTGECSGDKTGVDVMEVDEVEECPEDDKNLEETSTEQDLTQSDTSTSQFNDENSQSSQDSHNKEHIEEATSTKISILDDWEDTDSQQSDQKEKEKAAGEAVNKLMDDWEEEEEDESRKDVDG